MGSLSQYINIVSQILILVLPLIIFVAYLTYFERKIIGFIQLRVGPSLAGPLGLLQPIADALKLISKESISPKDANKISFILAPVITFVLALIGWAVIPFSKELHIANIDLGALYILAISALSVYGIIIAGWSSNSQYAFLGAIRSAAQMISYELSIGFIMLCVFLAKGSLNLVEIVENKIPLWQEIMLMPLAVMFFICGLAETNRHPFDLPEAESELVAGYNVEYSSTMFAMFFLGEYANMILISAMTSILFLGGYLPPFGLNIPFVPGYVWLCLKINFLLFCFIWVRATTPRYRYDQLIRIGWQFFLPITFVYFVIMSFLIYFIN